MHCLILGTYMPRQCGTSTFSKNLGSNMSRLGRRFSVAAVSDPYFTYSYPDEVIYVIRQEEMGDYINTANAVNKNDEIDLVIIQHDYDIYGGMDGDYLLEFTQQLQKPYLLVAHTVSSRPSVGRKEILNKLCLQAAAIVCMTRNSADLLIGIYGVMPERVYIIHHGVPAFKAKDRKLLKQEYGFAGRELITTFGLIGPGKGIEIGILAMKELIMKHKNLIYLIVGRTHPMVMNHEGEQFGDRYREMLLELVRVSGLQDHVKFIDKFLGPEELNEYLYMTDIYLSPSPKLDQAISGTLAYALGCGRAIVSTPNAYALEMLSQGQRGLVATDATTRELVELLDRILSEPGLKTTLEKRSARLGARIKWPYMAKQYANLAERVLGSRIAI